jgi:hypothetical protein
VKTLLDHRTPKANQYDIDFYIWTQEQAALLRQVPHGSFALDIENLAEEIESMGRAEVSKVSSLLRQVLIHLLKMAIEPDSLSQRHWVSEVLTFQYDAMAAFTPGMKQRLEFDQIWKTACNATARQLESAQLPVPAWPAVCPLSLDDLLVSDFDPAPAAARVKAALQSARDTSRS